MTRTRKITLVDTHTHTHAGTHEHTQENPHAYADAMQSYYCIDGAPDPFGTTDESYRS